MTCALSRRSWLDPADRGESIGPGTAATVRQRANAWLAVFTAPDLYGASTTMVTFAKAAIIRFRRGKHPGAAGVPGSFSGGTRPSAARRGGGARRGAGAGGA